MLISKAKPVLAALSLVAVGGCISSPVVAPPESQIFVSAEETNIVLNAYSDPPEPDASTLITAQVLSMSGVPQSGVEVVFSKTGGKLASQPDEDEPPLPLRTDDEGLVSDTLTLRLEDPDTVTVTARSGTLSNSIEITKTNRPQNQPPLAVIDIEPASALIDLAVTYDGTGSADPDGDPITCYQWMFETFANFETDPVNDLNNYLGCFPSGNSRCRIVQGPFQTNVRITYTSEQPTVVVTLRVTDDPDVDCSTGSVTEDTAFNSMATDSHDVVCDRFMPMADAGINRLASRRCAASGLVCTSDATCDTVANPGDVCLSTFFATLDGAGSSGGDSGILEYRWSCGSGEVTCPSNPLATGTDFGPRCSTFGSAPPDENCCGPSGSEVTCVYPTAVSDDSFMVELQVVNGCQTLSGTDMTTVTIP